MDANSSMWMLFFGVFFAETVKNVAKGTANALQNSINNYLQPEIITLNLTSTDSPEEIQNKLESQPEVKALIQEKIEAKPELLNQLRETLKKI